MDPGEDTIVSWSDFGYSAKRLRSDPQLRWTDEIGSHSFLLGGRLVVGSADGADIVVSAPEVSRLHAAIEVKEDGVWIYDLGSRNGTYVNGVMVQAARVPDNGQIHLGSTDMLLVYDQNASEVELWPAEQFNGLYGRTAVMRELFARINRVAQLDSTVLIQGETGTGKELVARAIHQASPRKDKPFVVVDCGALAESLLEAELFGHAKGAFTGAQGARPGAIEAAEGGTVFLDEIGEMPLAMQPKLLRAIERHEVRRVGETAYRSVNVRFLSATHRDLAAMVNKGTFREDLYFRLAVLPITIPPLRDRVEDIPLLADRLLPQGTHGRISPELMGELCTRAWPGNVRELRNFVERAVALGAREALAMHGAAAGKAGRAAAASNGHGANGAAAANAGAGAGGEQFPQVSTEEPFKEIRDRWLDHLEREYMRAMIARHNRDTVAIAQASGLDRSYVYRLIRKHEL